LEIKDEISKRAHDGGKIKRRTLAAANADHERRYNDDGKKNETQYRKPVKIQTILFAERTKDVFKEI